MNKWVLGALVVGGGWWLFFQPSKPQPQPTPEPIAPQWEPIKERSPYDPSLIVTKYLKDTAISVKGRLTAVRAAVIWDLVGTKLYIQNTATKNTVYEKTLSAGRDLVVTNADLKAADAILSKGI